MNPFEEALIVETRRQFFSRTARGLGVAALATLFGPNGALSAAGLAGLPHFAPKAKRAVYMHMLGGPPQQDLFDYKPVLNDWYDKDLPDSIRQGQRLTTMSSGRNSPRRWLAKPHRRSRPVPCRMKTRFAPLAGS